MKKVNKRQSFIRESICRREKERKRELRESGERESM